MDESDTAPSANRLVFLAWLKFAFHKQVLCAAIAQSQRNLIATFGSGPNRFRSRQAWTPMPYGQRCRIRPCPRTNNLR